jgi:hypothetical protein
MALTPCIVGEYKLMYRPGGDRFPGPDSDHLKAGQWYDDWIANDHSFVRDREGVWHGFGIISPACPGLHEGAWMSFHITSPPSSTGVQLGEPWTEHPKVLTPADRSEERKELYAPYVVERDGRYYMFYGPHEMRLAVSDDLFHWELQGPQFAQDGVTRDPCVVRIDGVYHMVYTAGQSVFLRTSRDLLEWTDPPKEVYRMDRDGLPESPVLVERDGEFYLFWCIYDGTNTAYDNRTFVFRSHTPDDFTRADPLPMLLAHCPELIEDDTGQWYISSAEWPARGISLARLAWD